MNNNFLQIQCNKHEYTLVTQTTNIKNSVPITWEQCKHCGKIK